MFHSHDAIVLGHGLAGAAFARVCHQRARRVAVLHEPRPGEASLAAAALVNPVVVRRILPSWRAATLLPIAQQYYQQAEALHGARFWHPVPLDTVFPNTDVADQWHRRRHDDDLAAFIGEAGPAPHSVQQPHGAGRVQVCAWLDVRAYLTAERERLAASGDLLPTGTLVERTAHGFRAGPCTAPLLVHCTGAFTPRPGLVPVKGETIDLHIPGADLPHVWHRHVFILPLGDDRYRVGATFSWDHVWNGPSDEARQWLLDKVAAVLKPEVMAHARVVGQTSGVRPTTRDRRPILGSIAPGEAILNGLGVRGVMLAPWCAQHLADHLFDGAPLDPEVDVARWAKAE